MLGLSYLLTGLFIFRLNVLALIPGWNLLVSYLFFGALLLLGALYRLLFVVPASEDSVTDAPAVNGAEVH